MIHGECFFCKQTIYEGDEYATVNNRLYHIECAPYEDFFDAASSNLPTKKFLNMPTFKGSGFSFGIKKINDNSFVVKISEDTHFARVFIDRNQALQISEWLAENLK